MPIIYICIQIQSIHHNTTRTPKIRRNWASQFVSPDDQHIVARRCIENPENGFGGMSRLVGLQHRQAIFGKFQKHEQFITFLAES